MDLAAFYLLHCLADENFYDSVRWWDDSDSRFALADQEPPAGWDRAERGTWVFLLPPGRRLPDQGWKVHVSAHVTNCAEVLAVVRDFCVEHRVAFRFLRSVAAVRLANSKHADRASSGRFCTLYPGGVDELDLVLTTLGEALSGQPGPYVLGDLRWRSGPLSVRYGAFRRRHRMDETGELVPALTDPSGRLVPDPRGVAFRVPSWVEVPARLAEQIAARDADRVTLPYQVREALHFSNAGGVYLAVDPRSGRRVVIKEARPLAGLDGEDVDAVERLRRERSALERLSDVDVVPSVLGGFVRWEHHFLVEEHIEGEPLTRCVEARHPFSLPDPSRERVAAFTAWALDVLDRLRAAVDVVHRRGLVVGDLHPSNVIVRPDGRVALVDLEQAMPVCSRRNAALGAPGFAAPPDRVGVAIDDHAMACVALWMFLPFAPVLRVRDPDKTELFLGVLADDFGVPDSLLTELRRQFRPTRATATPEPAEPAGTAGAAVGQRRNRPLRTVEVESRRAVRRALADPGPSDWPVLLRSIAHGVLASATPLRRDRLFPGDVEQFRSGGVNLAHGAAGVLLALASAGAPIDPHHVDWLLRAVQDWDTPRPGFYTGLHGVAFTLDQLGRRAAALSVLDRAVELMSGGVPARGLFGGLAGIGLNLLHFGHATDDVVLRRSALVVADQLADQMVGADERGDPSPRAGLAHGGAGIALFFLHCYRDTLDTAFLDLAATALRADLARCRVGAGGALHVVEGGDALPSLHSGAAGIGLVLREFLRHRHDERFAHALDRVRRTCRVQSVAFPGLFSGHAGLLATAAVLGDQPPLANPAVRAHLRRLSWHAEFHRGRLAFPGEQLFRLSTDLGTGAAGVLLALATVFENRPGFLPFLPVGTDPLDAEPETNGGHWVGLPAPRCGSGAR
ncbi:Protein kinase domain-containing protein [Streptoalloteichus tenebrarius]|uniref:non-specific serine/threonine protein kinase n=1 Tax=Streptoalloteichus tenebrarius (strain ATCC 17920 / DSM 40477 / JCM 4838 / CBS 697.72 / NBRC 16177 / NCIMB 11028 / NRRL B-12390 / A12253. 1 / ISP 5477) TaxID=1933 RepID=A0ABT1HU30_STRSD|nr:class III lanthionine synthetase LanKC [Streptoalloteichus tenebrarius]MCP2259035.1 Protein kinase domain-containing protein [Streptoalloteichus tenebrarius]BFE99640.1 class III lanthionine synthetase LanKC [Streptoalloteichus tenebrarius]